MEIEGGAAVVALRRARESSQDAIGEGEEAARGAPQQTVREAEHRGGCIS